MDHRWNRPLHYRLKTPDRPQRELGTLHDAAIYICLSGPVGMPAGGLGPALVMLIRAAETGKPEDIKSATIKVEEVLDCERCV